MTFLNAYFNDIMVINIRALGLVITFNNIIKYLKKIFTL